MTHQLGSRYREGTKKFAGADGEAFYEHVSKYQQVMRSMGATHDQKLEPMYHILEGEAKRYFDEQVEGQVATFAEAVSLISERFNPEVTQTQTRNELSLLRFNAYVKQGMTEEKSLKEPHTVIAKNAPLLPLEYRADRQKRAFLRHALLGVAWAEPVLNRCISQGVCFQTMYAEL